MKTKRDPLLSTHFVAALCPPPLLPLLQPRQTCKYTYAPGSCKRFQCLAPSTLLLDQPPQLAGFQGNISFTCNDATNGVTPRPSLVTASDPGNPSFSPVTLFGESHCLASRDNDTTLTITRTWESLPDLAGNSTSHTQTVTVVGDTSLYAGCVSDCNADGTVCTCRPGRLHTARACLYPPDGQW